MERRQQLQDDAVTARWHIVAATARILICQAVSLVAGYGREALGAAWECGAAAGVGAIVKVFYAEAWQGGGGEATGELGEPVRAEGVKEVAMEGCAASARANVAAAILLGL
eukprot:jgi/Ulvmu1/3441/UM016_0060.1